MATDINQQLFQQLAQFAFRPVSSPARKPSDYDIALKILTDSRGSINANPWRPSLGGGAVASRQDKDKGPGLFGRIIDVLSRPLYGTANVVKKSFGNAASGEFDPINALPMSGLNMLANPGELWEGLAGRDKTTTRDITKHIEEKGVEVPDVLQKGATGFAFNLAGDIAMDPLVGLPPVGLGKAGIRGGAKALGKTHPQWADPSWVKKQRKLDKIGSPRLTEPPVISPNVAPKSFRFGTRAEDSSALPNNFQVTFPQTLQMPGSSVAVTSKAAASGAVSRADIAKELHKQVSDAVDSATKNLPTTDIGRSYTAIQMGRANTIIGAGGITANNADQVIEALRKVKGPGRKSNPIGEDLYKSISTNPAVAADAVLKDGQLVNTALDAGTRDAAAAKQILSPQQAAMHAQRIKADGKTVLNAGDASPQAKKTYTNLMDDIIYKSRGAAQNAIDRNASKLTIPVSKTTQRKLKGPGGRFLAYGTPFPTAAKSGTARASQSDASKGIISALDLEKAREAQKAIIEQRKSSIQLTRTVPKGSYTFSGQFKPAPKSEPKVRGVFGPVNSAVSKALRESEDIDITKLKPGETLSRDSVVHGIVARFSTHLGQSDLRPIALNHTGSAMARSSARYKALQTALKPFNDRSATEAWDIARGVRPADLASDPSVLKLSDTLRGLMEEFFRSRAIPESFAKGNSVAMRTGMAMNDINRMLGRFNVPFKFTNGVATNPVTGAPVSYEKGTNWLISWEGKKLDTKDDLARFIFGLQSAGEQLAAEYAFIDDVAYRMGSRGKTDIHKYKVDHPRLADYYFDADVADQLSRALKTLGEVYSPKSPVTRFMRQALSMWKTGVTIYNPRHHIVNMIGDVFLAWMAGVNDPRVFGQAAKVMHANRGQYKDLASVDVLTNKNSIRNALARPGSTVLKNKSGHKFTAQQVYVLAFNHGLIQQASVTEDIVKGGLPLPGRLAKPLGGHAHNLASSVSETREHFVKLAHFVDALQKSRGSNVLQISEEAANQVRKWHPDGLDLTKTEQAIRTLIIPFYSWMRKSTPLVIEGALSNPHKAFTSYAKVNLNLQEALGIEGTTLSNPYPEDQLFPSWLKDDNTPVLGKTDMPGLAGIIGRLGRQGQDDEGNPINAYTLGMPNNPMQDFFKEYGGFKSFGETKDALLSSVSPFIGIPLELQQGRELYTQIPLENRHQDYITSQIPIVSQVARMTNVGPFGPTGRAEKEGFGSSEATFNWLTGMGITGSGPQIKTAEFERLPEKREENKKIREFSHSIGFPVSDKGRIPEWIRELYHQRQGSN